MDLRTGMGFPAGRAARLRAVPDADPASCTAFVDAGDAVDVREGLALLRDAATLVTAPQRLDGLLLQLTVNPFGPGAHRALGSYLVGPGPLALAAYERVSASTARGI
jgi:hypothetical protein